MQAQQARTQAQIAALQKQVEAAQTEAAAAKATSAKAAVLVKADPPKVDRPKSPDTTDVLWKGGAPQLETADGKFSIKLRGVVQTDYEHANQDRAITSFPDLQATEFRRARLGVEGTAWWDYQYVLEVDLADDSTAIKDAYLQYSGLKIAGTSLLFRVGNFRRLVEQQTSDYFVDTFERSAFMILRDIDTGSIGFMTAYWTPAFRLGGRHLRVQGGSTTNGSTANPPLFSGFTAQTRDTTLQPARHSLRLIIGLALTATCCTSGPVSETRGVGEDQPLLTYRARCGDLHMTNFCVDPGTPTGIGGIGDGDVFWGLEEARPVGTVLGARRVWPSRCRPPEWRFHFLRSARRASYAPRPIPSSGSRTRTITAGICRQRGSSVDGKLMTMRENGVVPLSPIP